MSSCHGAFRPRQIWGQDRSGCISESGGKYAAGLEERGHLYIGVPIGPADRLLFNAHRIFSVQTVLSLFEGMALRDIAIVEPEGVAAKPIGGQDYQDIQEDSCGLFEFVKTAE